jgi:hypothetical protein
MPEIMDQMEQLRNTFTTIVRSFVLFETVVSLLVKSVMVITFVYFTHNP